MRFSRLIWIFIAVILVALGWLLTDSGIEFMHQKFLANPAADSARGGFNEAGLSRLGGFLQATFRFEKAESVLTDAITLYPDGANYWFNLYRLAKAKEKLDKEQEAVNILDRIIKENAGGGLDERLPSNNILELRRNKITEAIEQTDTGASEP